METSQKAAPRRRCIGAEPWRMGGRERGSSLRKAGEAGGNSSCGVCPPAGTGLLRLEQARTKGCAGGEGRHRPEADTKALPFPWHSHLVSLMETRVGKRKAESGGIPSFICLKTLPTLVSRVTIWRLPVLSVATHPIHSKFLSGNLKLNCRLNPAT